MMKQYFEIKEKYKDCLLLFRLGDFYELFFEDAITASKELSITLTGRDCGMSEKAPMCGMPYHAADSYIAKLVDKNYKVAICEQVEDAKKTKNIVKRDVVRVITKGTITDSNSLDQTKNNYIMCVFENKVGFGLSICDITTGEFLTTEISNSKKLIDEIAKYNPSEIIVNDRFSYSEQLNTIFNIKPSQYVDWSFDYNTCYKKLTEHFKIYNLEGFGFEKNPFMIISSGALLIYLLDTQKNSLFNITIIKKYDTNIFMNLDISSRRNLELTETIRENSKIGSLLWVLDKTKTAMGARLLRKWLDSPLVIKEHINLRLNAVEEFKNDVLLREEIKEVLTSMLDIQRLMGKVCFKTANAKDLISLKNSIEKMPIIKNLLSSCYSELLVSSYENMDTLDEIYDLLIKSIVEEPPFSIREGNFIKENFDKTLDTYKEVKAQGTNWLIKLETKEKQETGIKNLKVKYNKIFGYYIEITNSNLSNIPKHYTRKQTLANCERFSTDELKTLEVQILEAEEKLVVLEYDLFQEILAQIEVYQSRVAKVSDIIARLDVLISFAEISDKNKYTKPTFNDDGIIEITAGRHPVVERLLKNAFIDNDTYLDTKDSRLSIITGPNMAGKSTYMRQCALIVLIAQIGCFVPADFANISIVDKIFTRVGASDDLASGQSTFMIEMSEVANILNNATKNSLLILDEIGRGTSTFDGLSIAWAVLEYISEKIGAKTLFATHYHELTELEGKVEGVKNYCVAVSEQGEDIVFLRKIIRGGASSSLGIHVAKLAGVPTEVVDRASTILQFLNDADIAKNQLNDKKASKTIYYDDTPDESKIIVKDILKIDLDSLTAKDAINLLYELQSKAKNI